MLGGYLGVLAGNRCLPHLFGPSNDIKGWGEPLALPLKALSRCTAAGTQ